MLGPDAGETEARDSTSVEFEIPTLAGDGSGFSGDKALWLHSQVVSSRRM